MTIATQDQGIRMHKNLTGSLPDALLLRLLRLGCDDAAQHLSKSQVRSERRGCRERQQIHENIIGTPGKVLDWSIKL